MVNVTQSLGHVNERSAHNAQVMCKNFAMLSSRRSDPLLHRLHTLPPSKTIITMRGRNTGKARKPRNPPESHVQSSTDIPPADTTGPAVSARVAVSAAPNPTLPNETCCHIFGFFLVDTKWQGWSKLLLLSHGHERALLKNFALMRQTLPAVFGSLLGAVSELADRMYTLRSDRWEGILQVINGAVSGLNFESRELCYRLKGIRHIGAYENLPYTAVLNIAKDAKGHYAFDEGTWACLLRYMRKLPRDHDSRVEYERYPCVICLQLPSCSNSENQRLKKTVLDILRHYPERWFSKKLLALIEPLKDTAFFSEVVTLGKFLDTEVKSARSQPILASDEVRKFQRWNHVRAVVNLVDR